MRKLLFVFGLALLSAGSVQATGRLIPTDKTLPPLAMTAHQVNVTIDEQVAVTHIEQTFHNHTNRQLEATYYLPVPKGANVRRFSMWVNGIEVPGELVEADKARKIYTDIVQRTMDPGLLEYMDNSLLKMRIFPVPPNGDQKITLSYTSVNPSENDLVEFVYPMKSADNKAFINQEKFSLSVNMKSQHPIQNIYSPSHSITMTRASDNQATVGFAKEQAIVDRDFQLFYNISTKDVGLNTLAHRPIVNQDGYFMLLVSPRAELSKTQKIPRDMVFVLDTSGSMRGKRMTQARNALKYCLDNLTPDDRFGLMNFATTVNKYTESLQPATKENIARAQKWVAALEASGGTAIDDALAAALELRTSDETRPFTVVFFTDGRPTIGETNSEKILANVGKKNTANTRIFSFGVGDDVNATFLDALSDRSRAISTYVRETEDIEAKTTGLYAKISNPVLSNLKISVGGDVKLNEVYPPQLPDLFHGTQLVVLGRYNGKGGKTTVKLTGMVGSEAKEFTYEVNFPERTVEDKPFVEDLWARRKVGYMLDQIRTNGEKKELVDEVVSLAKRYGITTPYTSYLVVPDGPLPPVTKGKFKKGGPPVPAPVPFGLAPAGGMGGAAAPKKVADFAKDVNKGDGKGGGAARGQIEDEQFRQLKESVDKGEAPKEALDGLQKAQTESKLNAKAQDALNRRDLDRVQAGELGVDLSVQSYNLRNQNCVTRTASKVVQSRNCLEVGGVWIDDGYTAKTPTVTVKAMSNAYFRILEIQPQVREVFQLGNHLVWVTPSGTALIIDQNDGSETMTDADIERLFVAVKK
jgi:Ca-activated chloride channel family protein